MRNQALFKKLLPVDYTMVMFELKVHSNLIQLKQKLKLSQSYFPNTDYTILKSQNFSIFPC